MSTDLQQHASVPDDVRRPRLTSLLLRSSVGVFGAEQVVLEIAGGLKRAGHNPIIGVIENSHHNCGDLFLRAREAGCETHFFRCSGPFDLSTAMRIRKFIDEQQVDIVHCHGYKADFYGIFGSMFTKAKTVATCHPWTETSYDVRARFYTRLDKYMLRWMHAVTAVSQSVRAEVSGNGRCSVIPNGINVRRFYVSANRDQLRRTIGVGDSDFLFGAVGRLVPEKGYDILIASAREIVKQFPNTKFVIVGDGVLREKLEAEVDACHLRQNVILAGARSDIPELLHAMDAFVLSSKSEGMPMAVLEAMASGKPIVATEVGNVPDLLEKGKSGRLVPPNDADALAVGLRGLLENSTLSDELGLAAKRRVAAHYSSDVMTSGYLRVYEHVLGFASCCSSSPKTS